MRLGVGIVIRKDTLVGRNGLIEVVLPPKVIRKVECVHPPVVAYPRQRLLRSAVFAYSDVLAWIDHHVSAAHFAC